MALNIVSEINRSLTPSLIEKIATTLGINVELARKGIATAIPALLAVFGSKAETATGANTISDVVAHADPDVFGKLSGGGQSDKLIESGKGVLSSLLGDNALSGITSAVAKQVGLGGAAGASLMAMASQLTLGGLAKTARSSGLDASSLLRSQEDNITSALPAGLGDQLSSAGVLAGGFAEHAGHYASEMERTVSLANPKTAATARGSSNWLVWLIPLLLVAAGLWYLFGRGTPTLTAIEPAPAPAVSSMTIEGVDIGRQLTTSLDGLRTTLGGITDAASAQAALPKLQETTTVVDNVTGLVGKLSAAQKSALATQVSTALPAIKEMANKALAIPGVPDAAKPAIDNLVAKLETLASSG